MKCVKSQGENIRQHAVKEKVERRMKRRNSQQSAGRARQGKNFPEDAARVKSVQRTTESNVLRDALWAQELTLFLLLTSLAVGLEEDLGLND